MALQRLVLELALIDGATAGVRGLGRNLQNMGAEGEAALKKLNGAMDDFKAGMRGLATSRAIKEGLVDRGVSAAATLQEALVGLEVNLDQGSVDQVKRQLAEVEANAARIAGPTKFNQGEAVGIHTDLLRAGLSLQDVGGQGGAAEAATQLATAEGLSADESVSAITTMGAIFRLQGDEYGTAADLLSRAGGSASTTPTQLREALAQASSAGTMGLDPTETLASLGVIANLGRGGGAGGTALNAFLRGAINNNQKMGLGLFDGDGEFIGLQAAAVRLREMTAGRSPQQVQGAMIQAFGDEGAPFAGALLQTGDKGLEATLARMDSARSLGSKVELMASTKTATDEALSGTVETTLATLFRPALEPLTALSSKTNDLVGSIGDAAREDPTLAQAASYGAMGLAGSAALYGAGRLARGGLRGAGALRSMGGLDGILGRGGALAEAKALEAAAGVTPVSVVNWPVGLGSGVGGLGSGQAGAAASGAAGARLAGAVPVVAAGAAGVGVGTWLNAAINRNDTANSWVEAGVASSVLANPMTRIMAELSDLVSGDNLVGELKRTRGAGVDKGVSVVVNMLPGGGAEVEVDDGGRVRRGMARGGTP